MKTLFTTVAAALLAVSFAASANAATKKTAAMAQQEASCKAQAAKKFSAIRFLARRDYVNSCMARASNAKAVQKKNS
jgi:hypothetical protein